MVEKGISLNVLSKDSLDSWIKHVGSLEKHCEILATVPLKFQPGTSYEYCGAHMVVGRVIEVASGMSLKDFMQTEVLDPMGSTAAWFPKEGDDLLPLFMFKAALEDPPRMDFECGLVDIGTEGFRSVHNHAGLLEIGGPAVWADGQMVGTADDVMRLCEFLTHRGRTMDGKQLLQQSTADLLMSNCLPGGTGLNWTYMPFTAPLCASFDENGSVGY